MTSSTQSSTPITLVEAVNQALFYEMAHDKDVIVLGEDVGPNGGVFRATAGLSQKFGVRHTTCRIHDCGIIDWHVDARFKTRC